MNKNNRRQFLKKISLLGLIGGFISLLFSDKRDTRYKAYYNFADDTGYWNNFTSCQEYNVGDIIKYNNGYIKILNKS